MRFLFSIVIFSLMFSANLYAWECSYLGSGTCERNLEREKSSYAAFSDPALTCYRYLKDKNDLLSSVTYCPYFQCDSDGNVLLHDNSLGAYIEEKPSYHGLKNCGGYMGPAYMDGRPTTNGCYSNCCYVDGKFSGAINYGPARNLCCKTLEAYKAADCTLDDQILEEMEAVVDGDHDGDGTIGDLIGDGSVEEDAVEGSMKVVSGSKSPKAYSRESNKRDTLTNVLENRSKNVVTIDKPLF